MAKIIEEAKVLGEIDAGDETTITNIVTNQEYDSEDHVTSDVVDINTATKEEHIRRDIKIFAPTLADMIGTSENN